MIPSDPRMAVNLVKAYNTYFKSPYKVGEVIVSPEEDFSSIKAQSSSLRTSKGIDIYKQGVLGQTIFFPVQFWKSQELYLEIDCCTIRITGKKTIIRTQISERSGTVKEQFDIGDYIFTIKGILIGNNRTFPDEKISQLRELYETTEEVELFNPISDLFLDKSKRVCIESLEFPEVEGKAYYHRPFSMVCETDFVESLHFE